MRRLEDSETVDTIFLFVPCPTKLKTLCSVSHCVIWHETVLHASFMRHITKRRQMEAATQSSHQLIKLKTKLVAELRGLKWERNVRTVDSFIIPNSVSKLFMVHGEFDYSRGSETECSRPTSPRCVWNTYGKIRHNSESTWVRGMLFCDFAYLIGDDVKIRSGQLTTHNTTVTCKTVTTRIFSRRTTPHKSPGTRF